MVKKSTLRFEASARLQTLIGRSLVPNEEMAIVELVKNAYDSEAHKVRIFVQPETDKEPGIIRITDDGSGMSEKEIDQLFMFAGYSERPDHISSSRRVPTGEKGIGRFATDKLGGTLDVFTAKEPRSGVHLTIDWRDFETAGRKKFNEVNATYEVTDLRARLRGKSGTVLEIGHLRKRWEASQVDSLIAWLGDLLNPFSPPDDFSIELEVAGSKKGTINIDPSPPDGDVTLEMSVTRDKVYRTVREREKRSLIRDDAVGSTADLTALKGLKARFVHFDKRPNKTRTHGLLPGVRVYRDGFRIEAAGSRTADWLGVSAERAKRAGHAHVVPNRLFGFVQISRVKNPELGDTTSRQALLDTDAARNLVSVLREGISSLGDVLRSRTEPRWRENVQRKSAELEQARLHALGEVAAGLAHELRQPMQSIRSEADNIRERLTQLGITDPDIAESQQAIDRGIVRIDKNIVLISNLSQGNLTDAAKVDVARLLKGEIDVLSNRSAPRGITVKLVGPDSQTATINETAVLAVVGNLLQNAAQSIENSQVVPNRKKIIVVSLSSRRGFHRIEIEDNGDGVLKEIQPKLFTKTATNKTGGMGFGLYYCKILVEAHRGRIGYEPRNPGAMFWFELPEANL